MTKYSKVYLRNKKQSNISLPLRYSFLSSIFVDQMSVKNAALKWKIHYSSAKIIARMAKRSNLQSIFKKNQKPTACCTWKELNSDTKSLPSESCQRELSGSESTQNCLVKNIVLVHPKKIQVISTIGWSYLKGIPLQSLC